MSRKGGGRWLTSIGDCTDASTQRLKNNIKKNKERLFKAADKSIGKIGSNKKTTKTRKQKWEEKQLYEYFKWQTNKIAYKKTLT